MEEHFRRNIEEVTDKHNTLEIKFGMLRQEVSELRDAIAELNATINLNMERLSDMAADKAVNKITVRAYQGIGQAVIEKLSWVCGVIAIGLFVWLNSRGVVKWPP